MRAGILNKVSRVICFVSSDSHTKIIWLHILVFNDHAILHFGDDVYVFEFYSIKVAQNCFDSFNCLIQADMTIKFSFVMLCAIWYHLYYLKNVKKCPWRSVTKSNTPP